LGSTTLMYLYSGSTNENKSPQPVSARCDRYHYQQHRHQSNAQHVAAIETAIQNTMTAVITGTSAVPKSATTTITASIATASSACRSVPRSLIDSLRRETKYARNRISAGLANSDG